jgi:uncharacterized protein (TIGR03435 family)
MRGGPGTDDPGQIDYRNVALITLVRSAWHVYPFQIVGPAWLSSETYDISAKIPPAATPEQFRLMLMNLLIERFHLVLHHESRQVSCYALTVGTEGSKLVESQAAGLAPTNTASDFPKLDHPGVAMKMGVPAGATKPSVYLTARAQTVAGLVHTIGEQLGCPILDKTGLASTYDYMLQFVPGVGGSPGAQPGLETEPDQSGPDIISAAQQQLGLRLVRARVESDTIVIDRADREPSAN